VIELISTRLSVTEEQISSKQKMYSTVSFAINNEELQFLQKLYKESIDFVKELSIYLMFMGHNNMHHNNILVYNS